MYIVIFALFTKTEKNLKNIGATAPAVQAKTYYGSTRYLNTEFYSVTDIIDGKTQYKFIGGSANLDNLRKNGYNYNTQKQTARFFRRLPPRCKPTTTTFLPPAQKRIKSWKPTRCT